MATSSVSTTTSGNINSLSYERIETISEHLRSLTKHTKPIIGLVCGSGFSHLVDRLVDPEVIPFEKVPEIPKGTVKGHESKFVFGTIEGKTVIAMQGRLHYYEGFTFEQTVLPIRLMYFLGVKIVILTNAAGGVNQSYNIGDLMILKDHIFLPGVVGISPLRGPNDDRFLSLHDVYDLELRKLARKIAADQSLPIQEGVYAMGFGPQFETPSEIKLLQILNADAIGMSTCAEAMVARHCGMKVFGMSGISDKCSAEFDHGIVTAHEDVLAATKKIGPMASNFIYELIKQISM